MQNKIVARRYAKGLMLSLKPTSYEAVCQQLGDVVQYFSNPSLSLMRIFQNPSFSTTERHIVVEKIIGYGDVCQTLKNFLRLLVLKNRITLLASIHSELTSLVDRELNRSRVRITSAHPMENDEVDALTAALKSYVKSELVTETRVDPSLLAGIKVQISDMVFDSSAKAKLAEVKERLEHDFGY